MTHNDVFGETEMKIAMVTLVMVLTCSCQKDNPALRGSEETMERREEVRKIAASYFHSGVDIIRGPLTVREVQKELIKAGKRPGEVAGWTELKAELRQGDELYFCETDTASWSELRGRTGYLAIRQNEIIGVALTSMN